MPFSYSEKLHILFRHYEIPCGLCGKRIEYMKDRPLGDYVEFDDWIADGIDNKGHDIEHGQPVHPHCHKLKSIEDTKRAAKIKRLLGETKTKKVKIQSRGFNKMLKKKMNGKVERITKAKGEEND